MERRSLSERPASLILHHQKVRSACWFAVDVIVSVKAVMESVLHACFTPDLVLRHPHSPLSDWGECPRYSTHRPNECFFDEKHTSVWTPYTIQLRSRDESITYDQKVLVVEDIGELPGVGDQTQDLQHVCFRGVSPGLDSVL